MPRELSSILYSLTPGTNYCSLKDLIAAFIPSFAETDATQFPGEFIITEFLFLSETKESPHESRLFSVFYENSSLA